MTWAFSVVASLVRATVPTITTPVVSSIIAAVCEVYSVNWSGKRVRYKGTYHRHVHHHCLRSRRGRRRCLRGLHRFLHRDHHLGEYG